MTGYLTIVSMCVALAFAIASAFGIIIPESEQAAILGGVTAIAGILLRFRTNTTVFKSTSPAPMPDVTSSYLKGPGA